MNAVLCAVLVQHTKTSDFGAIYMPLGPKLILVRYGAVPKALLFSRDGSHINFGLKFLNASLCAGSRFRGGSCWRLWRFGGGLCTYQQDTVGV